MKNILLIGKFNSIFHKNSVFDGLYNAQICVDNVQMVKGILKLKHTDLVVVSLIGISADAKKIFEELKSNYSTIPVVCIGTSDEVDVYANSINTSQFTKLLSPKDNDKIVDTINQVLKGDNNKKLSDDNIEEKKSILLVDDSNIQLRALRELLKGKYEVRMATSGMQALTMIGKKKPDMIFLDYDMPICDGKMTFEMIRGLEEAKDIPVVFLTGVNDKEHIAAVLNLKPAGYLLKPASANMIYEIIEKTIG